MPPKMAGARPSGRPAATVARARGSPPTSRHALAPTLVSLVLVAAFLPARTAGQVLTRINCGGDEVTDRHGHVWQADNFASPVGEGHLSGYYEADLSRELTDLPESIAASPNWAVYLTERFEKKRHLPVVYSIPTQGAGTYRVLLHFADTCPCTFQHGTYGRMRKFGVTINDQQVMSEYDIGAEVGWGNVAIKMFHVAAGNADNITIRAVRGSIQNPMINGIEIFRGDTNECSLGQLARFMCHDPGAGCVASELRCDNSPDCADGSDERACDSSLDNGFVVPIVTMPPTLTPTTATPTAAPSPVPTTAEPTAEPSLAPASSEPSAAPSVAPTTEVPTGTPTTLPTGSEPTAAPTATPTTAEPTAGPSVPPTSSVPSAAPSAAPTGSPLSSGPTAVPSAAPSAGPSTSGPTLAPSATPTSSTPTASPNTAPPTAAPATSQPTASIEPTSAPSTPAPSTLAPSAVPPTAPLNAVLVPERDLQADAGADAISQGDAEVEAVFTTTNLVVTLSAVLVIMLAVAIVHRQNRGRMSLGDLEDPRGKLGRIRMTKRRTGDGLEWDATAASTVDGGDKEFKGGVHGGFDFPDGNITKVVTSSGIFKAVNMQSPGASHAMVSIGSPTGETNLDDDDVSSEYAESMSVADSMFSYTDKPQRKQVGSSEQDISPLANTNDPS